MKKPLMSLVLAGLLAAVWFGAASAQAPDPRDSVILESKPVKPQSGPTAGDTTIKVRMYITNKDSLNGFVISFETKTLTNGAYATLGRSAGGTGARNNASIYTLIPHPVKGATTLNVLAPPNVQRYHSDSPDSFSGGGFFTAGDDESKEPPNATRRAFLELKFDSVVVTPLTDGQFQIDTVQILANRTGFTRVPTGARVNINYVIGLITVQGTDVREINPGAIPRQYALSQNYPNPFNANTQITFALPKAGNTRLDIFNVLGQKVSTLVNEYMSAGSKIVNWDGRDDRGVDVPSGIYFYRLSSLDFLQTKKMLLVK